MTDGYNGYIGHDSFADVCRVLSVPSLPRMLSTRASIHARRHRYFRRLYLETKVPCPFCFKKGIYVTLETRGYRDVHGKTFSLHFEIIDHRKTCGLNGHQCRQTSKHV